MSKMQLQAKLVKKEQLKDDIFKFSVEAQEIVNIAKSGQFLEIRVTDQVEPFLRRPISIYNLDKENGILEYLLLNLGRPVSQEELMEHVWDASVDSFSGAIRVHMSSLRRKLKAVLGYDPILNKVGEGYKIREEADR